MGASEGEKPTAAIPLHLPPEGPGGYDASKGRRDWALTTAPFAILAPTPIPSSPPHSDRGSSHPSTAHTLPAPPHGRAAAKKSEKNGLRCSAQAGRAPPGQTAKRNGCGTACFVSLPWLAASQLLPPPSPSSHLSSFPPPPPRRRGGSSPLRAALRRRHRRAEWCHLTAASAAPAQQPPPAAAAAAPAAAAAAAALPQRPSQPRAGGEQELVKPPPSPAPPPGREGPVGTE